MTSVFLLLDIYILDPRKFPPNVFIKRDLMNVRYLEV